MAIKRKSFFFVNQKCVVLAKLRRYNNKLSINQLFPEQLQIQDNSKSYSKFINVKETIYITQINRFLSIDKFWISKFGRPIQKFWVPKWMFKSVHTTQADDLDSLKIMHVFMSYNDALYYRSSTITTSAVIVLLLIL